MRPKIICHMAGSIDGRLLVDRWTPPASGIDRAMLMGYYDQIAARFGADGWIVGRKSMEPYTQGKHNAQTETSSTNLRPAFFANRGGRTIAVAIDPHGKLRYGQDNAGGDHIVAIVGDQVSDQYLANLQADGVSYIVTGAGGRDVAGALDMLGAKLGVKTLLLEGGGVTCGQFLKDGLIDEISLLIYPGIDGLAGVPSIFEYIGQPGEKPAAGQSLRHLATETLNGGMVWIHYNVEPSKSR